MKSGIKKVIVSSLTAVLLLSGCGNNDVQRGLKFMEAKEYKEAEQAFEKSVQEGKNKAEAYRGLGMACFEQKKYKEAADAFKKVKENNGKETVTLYQLTGSSLLKAGQYKEAVEEFLKGIDLGTILIEREEKNAKDYSVKVREMRYNLIICYEKMGDWENARNTAESYLEDYPDDKEVEREADFLETR